jgi:aminoglycoside 6'-N-acetyltransferase
VGPVTPRVIEFRPLEARDLALLRVWLEREHVARWWREPIERELAHELVGRFLIVVDARPVGLIQTYDGEVDLLIGEEELTGLGLGAEILSRFVEENVPGDFAFALVEEENRRSWRAFEKAGFRHVDDVDEDGLPHRLMRLDRS